MMRVFISYSWDSDSHKSQVLALAQRLRADGVSVIIDRDLPPGGPDEGFDTWSEKLADRAERVLLIFTESYRLCWDGEHPPGMRQGATFEAKLLKQRAYRCGVKIDFCRPVVFSPEHQQHIPTLIGGLRSFCLDRDYPDLLAWLQLDSAARETPAPVSELAPPTEPVSALAPISEPTPVSPTAPVPVSAVPIPLPGSPQLWPGHNAAYRWPLADRKHEFDLFRQMISGTKKQRIMLVKGGSNSGKTTLLGGLKDYAHDRGLIQARLDFRGCPTLDDVFDQLRFALKKPLPALASAAKSPLDFIEGLQELEIPLILLFDTYETASEEARNWLERRLLHYIEDMPAVVAVVGGQQIPDHAKSAWQNHAVSCELAGIDRAEDWLDYIRHRWPEAETPDTAAQLQFVTQATGGVAGHVNTLLERFFEPSSQVREFKS